MRRWAAGPRRWLLPPWLRRGPRSCTRRPRRAPTASAQVLATLRWEMVDVKNATKSDLLEFRGSLDKVFERVGSMQDVVDKAAAPLAETVERHEVSTVDHDEQVKHMDAKISVQAAALEEMRLEFQELRGAQSTSEATVQEVCREFAMSPGAPPTVLPRVSRGWDRAVEPHVLQANTGTSFSAEALVAALVPIVEVSNLSLDDIEVRTPGGITVAQRWTLDVERPDARVVARRASMVMGVSRE